MKDAQMKWAEYAYNQAKRIGIDDPQYPALFVAKIMQESSFNPTSRGEAGGIGIAQLNPEAAEQLGVDARDPIASIDAALRIDAQNYEALNGNLMATLAAYHVGQDSVASAMQSGSQLPIEAQTYLNRVLTIHHPQVIEMFGADTGLTQDTRTPVPEDAAPRELVSMTANDKRRRDTLRREFELAVTSAESAQIDDYLGRFVEEYSSFAG